MTERRSRFRRALRTSCSVPLVLSSVNGPAYVILLPVDLLALRVREMAVIIFAVGAYFAIDSGFAVFRDWRSYPHLGDRT